MTNGKTLRFGTIAAILALGVLWSLVSAADRETAAYPNGEILATVEWLTAHQGDPGLVVVDVREDKHLEGALIPGAVRLPWTEFRYDDRARNLAEQFIGIDRAQEVLGRRGISRTDRLVLYDSVARDGGATASYVFWVLDLLGHREKRLIDGGIDAWKRAGHPVADTPRNAEPVLYQAPFSEIHPDQHIDGRWVYHRLGDSMYQILDVRSREEYLGQKGAKDLRGNPLVAGHIPGAVNVNYTAAWQDTETKRIRPYPELQELFRGLDPAKGVIVYCNSGRRSSFSYFVLRLMGIDQVITYAGSWMEWGNPENFFPVETVERRFAGEALPGTGPSASAGDTRTAEPSGPPQRGAPTGGYVSCGG